MFYRLNLKEMSKIPSETLWSNTMPGPRQTLETGLNLFRAPWEPLSSEHRVSQSKSIDG